jgi:thiol-disulfide isomerase/thioredoxin
MKKSIFLVLAVFLGFFGMAQRGQQTHTGFELTVKIAGYPEDQTIRMGRYYGAQTLFVSLDTTFFDQRRGVFVLRRNEPLEPGMYMLVSHENFPADFIVDQSQRFSIETRYPEFGADMTFTGSPENQIYVEFNERMRPFHQEFSELRRQFEALEDKTSPEGQALSEKIRTILENIEKIRTQFMQDNPKHLMTAVFRAQKDIDVPNAPDNSPEDEKRLWQFNYFKDHYFDNMDLSEDRLLRTPIFHQRLENYLEKVLQYQSPDSIKFAIGRLIEKTRENPELFKYVIWFTTDKYMRSQIIGYDAIWVYLAEMYYLSGDAVWASEATIENFRNAVNKTKPILIGNVPPEFWCPDTNVDRSNERFRSVFEPKTRYTIVMFWEPNCGHCKRAMPLLRDFYSTKREELDFEVFAVGRGNVDEWRKAIYSYDITHWINVNGKASNIRFDEVWDAQTSPTIYVLDSKKRIVTKRIDVEQIEPFIRNWNALYYSDQR